MTVKAVIPIKIYGSKELPNKSIMIMNGREMWEWVTIAAVQSKEIQEVYMTGNSVEKKMFYDTKVKYMYPTVKWITRPKKLQTDKVELMEVTKYIVDRVGKKDDIICQLVPSKPLTKSSDIDTLIKYFKENNLNSLATVKELIGAVNGEWKASRQTGSRNFIAQSICKIWDYQTIKNAKIGTWGKGEKHYDYIIEDQHIEVDNMNHFRMAEALMKGGL
jgi:CMP-N-acetylneuraminic acid synthetase